MDDNTHKNKWCTIIFFLILLAIASYLVFSAKAYYNLPNTLLYAKRGGHVNTLDYDMMYATGHADSIGNHFPGTTSVTSNSDNSYNITMTVETTEQGQLWQNGTIAFTYQISQNLGYVKPTNGNASTLDEYDGPIVNP